MLASPWGPVERPTRSVRAVAVIVVTFNSGEQVGPLLDSIPLAAPGLKVTTIVVDNASTDDTCRIVSERGDSVLLHSGGNLGYAAAINVARDRPPGDCDAIAILNPDLVLHEGALAELASVLRDGEVGVSVPRLESANGSIFQSLRLNPTLRGTLGEALFGARWASRPQWLADTVRDPAAYLRSRDVEWASGAAWMVAADCDRVVGAWDERYFLYSEEIDYAQRVRAAGYRIRYQPTAVASHIGGASGSSTALETLRAVNRIRVYRATHGRLATMLFRGAVATHHVLRSRRASDRAVLRSVMWRSSWARLPRARMEPPA